MKKSIITAVLMAQVLLTACSSTTVDVTTVSSEESETTTTTTTVTETTMSETEPEPTSLDLTLDEVVKKIFEDNGIELIPENSGYEIANDKWFIYNYEFNTISYPEGVIDVIECQCRIQLRSSSPKVEGVKMVRILQMDTESDLYKNLKVGDKIPVVWTSTADPTMTYDLQAMVSAINDQYVLCAVENNDYNEETQSISENSNAPYTHDDVQALYDSFTALG